MFVLPLLKDRIQHKRSSMVKVHGSLLCLPFLCSTSSFFLFLFTSVQHSLHKHWNADIPLWLHNNYMFTCILCNNCETYAFMPVFHKTKLTDTAGIIPRQQPPLCHLLYRQHSCYCYSYSRQFSVWLGQPETWCVYVSCFLAKQNNFSMSVLIDHWRNCISLMVLWVSN